LSPAHAQHCADPFQKHGPFLRIDQRLLGLKFGVLKEIMTQRRNCQCGLRRFGHLRFAGRNLGSDTSASF
jgi:hypothetical protein